MQFFSVHVCMYVCVCVSLHVYLYVCMYVSLHVCLYVCMYSLKNIEVMQLTEHLCDFLALAKERFIVLSTLIIFAYLYFLPLNYKHLPEFKRLFTKCCRHRQVK